MKKVHIGQVWKNAGAVLLAGAVLFNSGSGMILDASAQENGQEKPGKAADIFWGDATAINPGKTTLAEKTGPTELTEETETTEETGTTEEPEKKLKYTLTADYGDGTAPAEITLEEGELILEYIAPCEREGYTLTKWLYAGGGQVTAESAISENTNIYAVWELDSANYSVSDYVSYTKDKDIWYAGRQPESMKIEAVYPATEIFVVSGGALAETTDKNILILKKEAAGILEFYVSDGTLNSGSIALHIDNQGPEIKDVTIADEDEFKKEKRVSFRVSDKGSGLKSVIVTDAFGAMTECMQEGDSYSFITKENSTYLIRAQDFLGNEEEHSVAVDKLIDSGASVGMVYSDGTQIDELHWVKNRDKDIKLCIAPNSISQASFTKAQYCIDDMEWKDVEISDSFNMQDGGTAVLKAEDIPEGSYLKVQVTDTTGNISELNKRIMVDTAEPFNVSVSTTDKWFKNCIVFKMSAVDTGSGIAKFQLRNLPSNYYGPAEFNVKNGNISNENYTVKYEQDSGTNMWSAEVTVKTGANQEIIFDNVTVRAYDGVEAYADSASPVNMTADSVVPVLHIGYERQKNENSDRVAVPGENKNRPVYLTEGESAYITVKAADSYLDGNGDGCVTNITVCKDGSESGTEVKLEEKDISFSNGDTQWSGTIKIGRDSLFETEGYYEVQVTVTDEAGNQGSVKSTAIYVDTTAPVIESVSGEADGWIREDTVITGQAGDENSGLKEVWYTFSATDAFCVPDAEQVQKSDYIRAEVKGDRFSIKPSLQEDYEGYCLIWAYDEAGNAASAYALPVKADREKPVIQLTSMPPAIGNGNGTVSFTVQDPSVNGRASGLKTVTYEVICGNTVTARNQTDLSGNASGTYQGQIVIDAAVNEGDGVYVVITAEDINGNKSSKTSGSVSMDVTVPTVDVVYDNNTVYNEKYFAADRTATITITEKNFNSSLVEIATTGMVSGWSGSGDTHTATVTFSTEGLHEISISCKDLAGNEAERVNYGNTVLPGGFIIDKTVPRVSVTYRNDNGYESGYYNESRTAVITVEEENFDIDAASAGIKIECLDTGSGVSIPVLGGWTSSGNVHTATVNFEKDAQYSINIGITDMAMNASDEWPPETFILDQTLPDIQIEDVKNITAYREEVVAPSVIITDDNYDSYGVDIQLVGEVQGEVGNINTATVKDVANGQRFTFPNIEEDDIYTLLVTATDRAGNTRVLTVGGDAEAEEAAEEYLRFSVNRKGSVYTVSEETKQLLNKSYANQEQDIVIVETNVNILSSIKITITKNNTVFDVADLTGLDEITLKEGEGYTVERQEIEGGWSQYTYRLSKDNFAEDGIYRINIYSVDGAGNVSENLMDNKVTEINFGIDKTEPIYYMVDLQGGQTYAEEEKDVRFVASDNLKLKEVMVLLNGETVQTWGEQEIAEIENTGQEYIFAIPEDIKAQTVTVICTDAAGNRNQNQVISEIYVTTNLWVRFINNKTALWGTAAAAALIAAGAGFALYRKKTKAVV